MSALLICILTNVIIVILFKIFPRYGINNFQAIIFNYYTCLLVGTIQMGSFPIPLNIISEPWFPFVLFLSVLFISGFNFNALATQRIGVSYTTIVQKLSLIIPSSMAILFFGESAHAIKLFGIALAIPAIIFIQIPSKSKKVVKGIPLDRRTFFLLASSVFVISAAIECILFIMSSKGITSGADIPVVSSIFGFAGTIGLIILIVRIIKGSSKFHFKNVIAGVILGIPNFFSIYFLVYLLENGWDASILFPINNVGIIAFSAIAAFLLFKERLNRFQLLGLVMAIGAIILISL